MKSLSAKNALGRELIVTLAFEVLITFPAWSQFSEPTKDSLYSAVLKEHRTIDVILPDNYSKDTTHYDVWYVVDGEWNTKTFVNIYSFLISIGFAPPAIVVGVPNRYVRGFNLRDRDLTPTKWALVDSSGGASHFMDFFQKELMPYVRSKYRTGKESGLFGSSFGGLFAIYTLLQRPELFRFYIAGDPALHFDDKLVPIVAAKQLPTLPVKNIILHIGGRSGPSYQEMGRDKMDSILRLSAPGGLHWKSELYDQETHGSSVFKSNYDGLKYAYLGYSSLHTEYNLTGGIVLKDRPVKLLIPTDNADIHYTYDGSQPTLHSPLATDFILVSDPDKTMVKSFSPSGRYDRIIPMNLRRGNYLMPIKPQRKLPKLTGDGKYSEVGMLNGMVTIPRDGYYVLQLTPSQGTRLYFNETLWITADTLEGHPRQTIILPLRKGEYHLRVEHPETDSEAPPLNFGLYYSENGQDDWWKNVLLRW